MPAEGLSGEDKAVERAARARTSEPPRTLELLVQRERKVRPDFALEIDARRFDRGGAAAHRVPAKKELALHRFEFGDPLAHCGLHFVLGKARAGRTELTSG